MCLNPTYGEPGCSLALLEGDPAAVPVLTTLLKDEDIRIRRVAAAALGRIGPHGKEAFSALLETANSDEDAFLRGIARVALLDTDREAAEKAGISEYFMFCSPRPKLRAIVHGSFYLNSSVAFSADGKTLAVGGKNKTIQLCDVTTGKELVTLQEQTGAVWPVAFSPNGKILASANEDRSVKLWELATGKELTSLHGHTEPINSLAFSPESKTLASGSTDKTVKLRDVATSTELTSLQGHTGSIGALAFSPDGKSLASGSYDCTVKLWDIATGTERASLRRDPKRGFIKSLAFSPDGQTLTSGSYDYTVKLWGVATGKAQATLEGYNDDGQVDSVAFSPDGKTVASVSWDTIFLWDVASGQNTTTIYANVDSVRFAVFRPDGNLLAVGGDDQTVRLWEITVV